MLVFLPDFERGGPSPDVLQRFAVAVLASGFVVIEGFNWMTWRDAEGSLYIHDPSLLDAADMLTLRKYLTFLSRQDHFCVGFLGDAAFAGAPLRALQRLAIIRQTE